MIWSSLEEIELHPRAEGISSIKTREVENKIEHRDFYNTESNLSSQNSAHQVGKKEDNIEDRKVCQNQ